MPSTIPESRVRGMGQPGAVPYNPSLIFAFSRCVGHKVIVQTKTASEYEGILHTPGLKNADIHLVLRKARRLKDGRGVGEVVDRLIIPSGELVQVIANELAELPSSPSENVTGQTAPTQMVLKDGEITEGFMGDRDKVRNQDMAGLYGRALKKWEPDGGDDCLGLDDDQQAIGQWDQFKANEELFGVKSSFNMELYTSPLDVNKSRFSVAAADKIAKEMSKDPSSWTRGDGGIPDDSGLPAN